MGGDIASPSSTTQPSLNHPTLSDMRQSLTDVQQALVIAVVVAVLADAAVLVVVGGERTSSAFPTDYVRSC